MIICCKIFSNVNKSRDSQSQLKNQNMIASQIMQSYALLDSLQTIAVQKQVFRIKICEENILLGSQKKQS